MVPFLLQQDQRNYHKSGETNHTASTSTHWWERNCSPKDGSQNARADDKKLKFSLKKLGANSVSGIEEVNVFTNQGTEIHFHNLKVREALVVNTVSITDHTDTEQLTETLPSIFNQLSADSLTSLQRLAEALSTQCVDGKPSLVPREKEDDEVPDLLENFDKPSKNEADQ